METLLGVGIGIALMAVFIIVLKFADEKVCTHVCPQKKECFKNNRQGKLPPCITKNNKK